MKKWIVEREQKPNFSSEGNRTVYPPPYYNIRSIAQDIILGWKILPKFVALTPKAWNWPKDSIPGQGLLHGPVWETSKASCELWKLRPETLNQLKKNSLSEKMRNGNLTHPVFWEVCMMSVWVDTYFDNFSHQWHKQPHFQYPESCTHYICFRFEPHHWKCQVVVSPSSL